MSQINESRIKMPRKSLARKQNSARDEAHPLPGIAEVKEGGKTADQKFDVEINTIDVSDTSLKIGWNFNPDLAESSSFCYLLQWKLDGTDEWNALPNTVTVARVRLENLQANTKYSFRVRRKARESPDWSDFSKTYTFSTEKKSIAPTASEILNSPDPDDLQPHDDEELTEKSRYLLD